MVDDRLEGQVRDFLAELATFLDFERYSFKVGDLLANPQWPWGYEHGFYCFVASGEVVYVGRALGSTLGERISDQLLSTSDPGWARVVTDPDNCVEIFAVDAGHAYVASALEAYLIDRIQPRFNKRKQ